MTTLSNSRKGVLHTFHAKLLYCLVQQLAKETLLTIVSFARTGAGSLCTVICHFRLSIYGANSNYLNSMSNCDVGHLLLQLPFMNEYYTQFERDRGIEIFAVFVLTYSSTDKDEELTLFSCKLIGNYSSIDSHAQPCVYKIKSGIPKTCSNYNLCFYILLRK